MTSVWLRLYVCVYYLFILLLYKGNHLRSSAFGLWRSMMCTCSGGQRTCRRLALVLPKWDYNHRLNYSYQRRILYLYSGGASPMSEDHFTLLWPCVCVSGWLEKWVVSRYVTAIGERSRKKETCRTDEQLNKGPSGDHWKKIGVERHVGWGETLVQL